MYDRKDHYYKKAKEEGWASRAVYKLEQIHQKYRVLKRGDLVLDLGCSPGGWMEMAGRLVGKDGLVVGMDILPLKITLRPNMRYLQGDINDARNIEKLQALIEGRKFDVVLSDMAPNTSGIGFKDSFLSYELCMMAFETARKILRQGGNLVAKIFQGKEVEDLKKELRTGFNRVSQYLPPATREGSKEIYIIASGFKG